MLSFSFQYIGSSTAYAKFVLIFLLIIAQQRVSLNAINWQHYWQAKVLVGAESDQYVNICSFVVCCDRRWSSTQWHRVYTGLGNVPYVQFELIGDFISEPRCSKFAVRLQTSGNKMGCQEVRSNSGPKGQEWRELQRALSIGTYALCSFRVLELWSCSSAQNV